MCLHFFKILSASGSFLGSVLAIGSTTPEVWVVVSFWMMVFCNVGPGVGVRIYSLPLSTVFVLPRAGYPFKGCCQCLFTGNLKGDAIISRLSSPCTVCRLLGWPFCQMGFDFLLSFWLTSLNNNSGCWASCSVNSFQFFFSLFLFLFP